MGKIQRFEDLIAWQKSQDLAVDIYKVFSGSKDFGFRDQICRAVVSISNNIAEGFERNSQIEFKRFLSIAKSSCNEVKSMLYLAERLNYINKDELNLHLAKATEIQRIIAGLMAGITKKISETSAK